MSPGSDIKVDQNKRWNAIILQMEMKGVEFGPGLSEEELSSAENTFNFTFPPDLRTFLSIVLPLKEPPSPHSVTHNRRSDFPDWRNESRRSLQERLDWPAEGIYFDIEHTSFWNPVWGARPERLDDAITLAKDALEQVPTLIPIFAHRYIPDKPSTEGNPVFSVWQTDIIHYGNDLASYFANEFEFEAPEGSAGEPRHIDFWTWLVDENNRIDPTFQYSQDTI